MTFPTEWKNKTHVPNHQPVKMADIDVNSNLCVFVIDNSTVDIPTYKPH